jgi:hypothetical protein
VRVRDFEGASKSGEARDDDDQENRKLDETEEVLQTKTPFEGEAVNKESRSDACESHTSLVPATDFNVGSVKDVLSEDDGV